MPRILFEVAPNESKINTESKASIELQHSESGEVLWSVEITSPGGLRVDGERNEKSLRDSAVLAITEKIAQNKLPSFLCPGVHQQFPVVSTLP